MGSKVPRLSFSRLALWSAAGVHGDLIIISPKPYSIYLRGTISLGSLGSGFSLRFGFRVKGLKVEAFVGLAFQGLEFRFAFGYAHNQACYRALHAQSMDCSWKG